MPDVKLLKQYDGQSVSFAFEISDFDDKRLDYEQSIKHASQAGTSTSAQSGSMHILSNGKGITAWVRIRNHPSSRYIITIKLFDHGQMLYEHRYKLGAGDLNGS